MNKRRWLCIHNHFYQPPRENPWLEKIEYQQSAYPFHDWNERITSECYAPNALSRLLDEDGWVVSLENNYSKISFNFGPTLLSWLEDKEPIVYNRILEGDKESLERFGGHGSAIAQAYNHIILPLANRRDKETQIRWGIRDFEHRFGRQPESLWLPETAVDLESLEIMVDYGMKYVILAPRQAKMIRAEGGEWQDMSYEKVDPTRAYWVKLPGNKKIAAFFYDGPISKAVAFEGLLHNGETFATRLMDGFSTKSDHEQLVHIATDGETYGHHHNHGEMALTYALHYIEQNDLARVTNYGEYLEHNPPQFEAQIFEDSSWSCAHGIERWRSDCGCNSGGGYGTWKQDWRGPLRKSFDLLRDKMNPRYEEKLLAYTKDPWALRDDYIDVILNRDQDNVDQFFEKHCGSSLNLEEQETLLKALELQRHLLLMYTSCAWFFDEVSGLEAVQCIKYAYRAIQLHEELTGVSLIGDFKEKLSEAPSNIPEIGNGLKALEQYVEPARVDFLRVGAHYAVTALFDEFEKHSEVYCYEVEILDFQKRHAGRARLGFGQVKIRSKITFDEAHLAFAVIHFGDHNINAGVRYFASDDQYQRMKEEISKAFEIADFPECIRRLDRHYGSTMFSLKDLFHDEQCAIIERILNQTLSTLENNFRHIYENHYPLMSFLSEIESPLPKIFLNISEFIHNAGIKGALAQDEPDTEKILRYSKEAQSWRVTLDTEGLGYEFQRSLNRLMDQIEGDPENIDLLQSLLVEIKTAKSMHFDVDFWSVQNRYFIWKESLYPYIEKLSDKNGREIFVEIGKEIKVRLPA